MVFTLPTPDRTPPPQCLQKSISSGDRSCQSRSVTVDHALVNPVIVKIPKGVAENLLPSLTPSHVCCRAEWVILLLHHFHAPPTGTMDPAFPSHHPGSQDTPFPGIFWSPSKLLGRLRDVRTFLLYSILHLIPSRSG